MEYSFANFTKRNEKPLLRHFDSDEREREREREERRNLEGTRVGRERSVESANVNPIRLYSRF